MSDDSQRLFAVVASLIESSIVDGSLPEEGQVPSTNELAAFHRINPATAAKGVSQLVADGLLYKRRGIGMFVAPGARARLLERRRSELVDRFVDPLRAEAALLGLSTQDLVTLITGGEGSWGPSNSSTSRSDSATSSR